MAKSKQLAKGKNMAVRPEQIVEARFNLTARENDILDFVLSKIEDNDIRHYELSLNELSEIYNKGKTNVYRDLRSTIEKMEGKGFRIINYTNNTYDFFVWFSHISYRHNEGKIIVEIGLDLKKILLNMKKRIYYKIDYSMNLSSIYSKRIYYYLLNFLDEKKDYGWRVDKIDELREKLECPESYKRYAEFKRKVLDIAEKEINAITNITFTYEQIYTKNKITSIKFLIERKQKKETPKQQLIEPPPEPQLLTMDAVNMLESMGNYSIEFIDMLKLFVHKKVKRKDFDDIIDLVKRDFALIEDIYIKNKDKFINKDGGEIISVFLQSINDLELKKDEEKLITQVKQIIKEPLTNKDILKLLKVANNDIKLIFNKYKLTKNKKVNNLIGFLIKAIEEDYTTTENEVVATVEPKQNKFNNYQQREYDFDELEKKARERVIKKISENKN